MKLSVRLLKKLRRESKSSQRLQPGVPDFGASPEETDVPIWSEQRIHIVQPSSEKPQTAESAAGSGSGRRSVLDASPSLIKPSEQPDREQIDGVAHQDTEKSSDTGPVSKWPDPITSFQYKPLDNACDQIRLLRFDALSTHREIKVTLATFSLSHAPTYTALSYAWGEASEGRSIHIDGQVVLVQPSCRTALKQLQRHHLTEWYWIDAICINQDDDEEKGPQVGLMASIFGKAQQVALSFAKITKSEDWLMQMVAQRYEQFEQLQPASHSGLALSNGIHQWLKEYGDDFRYLEWRACVCPGQRHATSQPLSCLIMQLARAIYEMGMCSYWTRLWVIQEIAHAQAVVVLGWETLVPLHRFITFARSFVWSLKSLNEDMMQPEFETFPRFGIPMLNLAQRLYGALYPRSENIRTRFSLGELIGRFDKAQCSIPLDKIYALQSLVVWRKVDRLIESDYTISPLELVKRVLNMQDSFWECLAPACVIIKYMLDFETSGLEEIRRQRWNRCGVCASHVDHSNSPRHTLPVPETRDYLAIGWSCTIYAPATGGFQVAAKLQRIRQSSKDEVVQPSIPSIVKHLSKWTAECCSAAPFYPLLHVLYHGQETIGVTCSEARTGDQLLRITLTDVPGSVIRQVFAIVRPVGDIFAFIGYAILNHQDYFVIEHSPHWPSKIPADRTPILNFDVEDLLAMAHLQYTRSPQKLGPDECQAWYAEVLSTRICREPFSSYVSLMPRTGRRFRVEAEHQEFMSKMYPKAE